MRKSLMWTMLLISGYGLHPAAAQTSFSSRPPMPPALTSGQDLTTPHYARPVRLHPPEPIEAARARRAQRQAEFYRDYPGTPTSSRARLEPIRGRVVQ